ncbi:MAG TPA: single-stranded DNA-binding protein [Polyangiales bacterium]
MAEGLNRAILVGNLGMDPELKFTQGGQAVLRIRLATSESFVNKSGERQDRTEWHTVIVWGKRAEALNKILSKGRTIWVEGRIQTRSWEDKDGGKRYATEINANNIGLVGGGGGGGGRGNFGGEGGGGGGGYGGGGGGGGYGGGGAGGGGAGGDFGGGDFEGGNDDDIPF